MNIQQKKYLALRIDEEALKMLKDFENFEV